MGNLTAPVLCARSQDPVLSVSTRRYMSYSQLLDLRREESRVVRYVNPPRSVEVFRKPGRHQSQTCGIFKEDLAGISDQFSGRHSTRERRVDDACSTFYMK